MRLRERLDKIEGMLAALLGQKAVREFFTVEQFAEAVGRKPWTCRNWARTGRIRTERKRGGAGPYAAYRISALEMERYLREGLLPVEVIHADR